MKIYIDADGCPVVKQTVRIAARHNTPCVIICDTCHRFEYENAETIVVEKGTDSADFRLVNLIRKNDIAITQDYGLASMCLGKEAIVINQDGKQYTSENILGLLEFRALSKKIRSSGERLKGPSKRTAEQDKAFEAKLDEIIENGQKTPIVNTED